MFGKQDSESKAANGAVTIIGAGVRIVGDVAYSGYLRIQGEVVGNVTCTSESHGTTVVHAAGSVTGAIKSPNIVVGGRVSGPLHAVESIEVHDGASVGGDIHYKQLAIHEGGSVDGALQPLAAPPATRTKKERRVARPETPEVRELDGPHAHERRASDRFWTAGRIALGAVLIALLGATYWATRAPSDAEQSAVAPEAAAPAEPPPPEPQPAAEPPPVEPPAPAAAPRVEAKPAPEPRPEPELRKADPNTVLTVTGLDLAKPDDLFFVATREPVVLFKKRRGDSGDGTRIDLGAGAKRRFSISEGDVVRVARGRNLDMFYQGRKLMSGTVVSGAWITFAPLRAAKPPTPPPAASPPPPPAPTPAPVPAPEQ